MAPVSLRCLNVTHVQFFSFHLSQQVEVVVLQDALWCSKTLQIWHLGPVPTGNLYGGFWLVKWGQCLHPPTHTHRQELLPLLQGTYLCSLGMPTYSIQPPQWITFSSGLRSESYMSCAFQHGEF